MDFNLLKNNGLMAMVGVVIYTLLQLNLFVTQAQLEQQLRTLEAQIRSEYVTQHDIQDLKKSIDSINTKLDKLNERVR